METGIDIKCPNCGRMNPNASEKCICGYYFDKTKYSEKSDIEYRGRDYHSNNTEYPFLKSIIVIFYSLGCILVVLGLGILFSYFTKENKEEFTISLISGHWLTGFILILSGLFQLGFAEFLKIMIKIENNTRH